MRWLLLLLLLLLLGIWPSRRRKNSIQRLTYWYGASPLPGLYTLFFFGPSPPMKGLLILTWTFYWTDKLADPDVLSFVGPFGGAGLNFATHCAYFASFAWCARVISCDDWEKISFELGYLP